MLVRALSRGIGDVYKRKQKHYFVTFVNLCFDEPPPFFFSFFFCLFFPPSLIHFSRFRRTYLLRASLFSSVPLYYDPLLSSVSYPHRRLPSHHIIAHICFPSLIS